LIVLEAAGLRVGRSSRKKPVEEAMDNRCACCRGRFGLVRHRRAFRNFCSQRCVDRHDAWLLTQDRRNKSWSDCLWMASLGVVPYACDRAT
jgi:hypothetical protein